MRIYHFCNYYLSQIQCGIQSSHAQTEMALKYKAGKSHKSSQWLEWAKNHKTMICLNGGNQEMLQEILYLFEDSNDDFPWAFFRENKESLNGALTNVCIVLPERIYDGAKRIREGMNPDYIGFDIFETALIKLLNSCKLA